MPAAPDETEALARAAVSAWFSGAGRVEAGRFAAERICRELA